MEAFQELSPLEWSVMRSTAGKRAVHVADTFLHLADDAAEHSCLRTTARGWDTADSHCRHKEDRTGHTGQESHRAEIHTVGAVEEDLC